MAGMTMSEKPIAIVICNYNKKDFVVNCIKSVFESNFKDFDLIVVDNASTDASVEAINAEFSGKLTLLVNEENLGGSGGFARGMQFALDKGYKYIHLLDNDTVVEKDAVGALYEFMEEHPEAGACGSLICQMQNPEYIQDFGAMIIPENLGVKPLYGNKKRSEAPDFAECDYVAACSAMYRAEILKKIGVIDKEFFIYWDDMALSWEIRINGSKVYAFSKSVVLHNHGLINSKTTFRYYYFFRNEIRVFTKYLDDNKYEEFVQNLVKRLFRIFAANRLNKNSIFTYFHAFNDALNDIRNKADEYKIVPRLEFSEKLHALLSKKSNIIVVMQKQLPLFLLQRFIKNIKNATKAKISLIGYDGSFGDVDGVFVCDNPTIKDFDLIIEIPPHILDEKEFKHDRVYIDEYFNQLLDEDDFDFVENLDEHYKFFHNVFYEFVKSKLDALRKKI